jgi:hypothetical protein
LENYWKPGFGVRKIIINKNKLDEKETSKGFVLE